MRKLQQIANRLATNRYSPVTQRVIDGLLSVVALWLAYETIFSGQVPTSAAAQMWGALLKIALGRLAMNELFRCYRSIWRYVALRDLALLSRSYVSFSVVVVTLRFVIPGEHLQIPVGVCVAELLFSFTGATGARIARRVLYEAAARKLNRSPTPVLLIGAGGAGVNVANQLRGVASLRAVGFLDDDPRKLGLQVAGLKVLGPVSAVGPVSEKHKVQEVIVCVATPPREMLRRIWAICELLGLNVKIVPTLEAILERKVNICKFRQIEMNDLLGREAIERRWDDPAVVAAYAGKRILITGAGGSIGSELALQLSKAAPAALLLLDKDENGLHDTYSQLDDAGRARSTLVVADLRFTDRLRGVLETFRPEAVFHAAAHKHVHLMEVNPCEAITNNVTGTRNLVEQSVALGVSRFVQVSTDKAVQPTSIMGASKRVCEMIVQAQVRRGNGLFCCVRFGNVLGSRGSVVPIFQEQIRRGGPVTVTHQDAQRFLMTIPEAVGLLIQAGTLANNRDIFVLDMGEPVLIHKLAEDMIELSGLLPNRDIRIEITGLKPGEKLSEVLIDNASELHPTSVEKIKAIKTETPDAAIFATRLRALERAAWEGDVKGVYQQLAALNIGYCAPVPVRMWPVTPTHVIQAPAATRAFAPELS